MEDKKQKYDASAIAHLEGLEHVRKRPGMYIGSTSKAGLHHLVWEIVDNSVDEAMAGFANKINITITKDNEIKVQDNGRGIPVGIHPQFNISALEVVLTKLNAGGKFESGAYKVSGGLHGVGASVVNALSSKLEAWVKRDGKIYYAKFENGGNTIHSTNVIGEYEDHESGTTIQFAPDYTIMEQIPFDKSLIIDHARQIAYLNKGLFVSVADERDESYVEYQYNNGIIDYVSELTKRSLPLTNIIYASNSYKYRHEINSREINIEVEVAMQYLNDLYRSNLISYTNNISTHEGGSHLTGFYDAIMRLVNNYALEKNFIKNENDRFTREDLVEGIVAVISIKHPEPQFEGQTKGKLGSKDARKAVNEVFSQVFERFLNENPDLAKKILEKASSARRARIASTAARDKERKKLPFETGSIPGKLAPCSSKNAEICELFIVEGQSAGGSAKMGRDKVFQAILPLKGKILNTERARLESILKNEEIMSLITAMGAGLDSNFNINKLRYHKIIIMTDADVDGAHIRTLLLTFFYRYFKPLIEYGFIYIAQPPLFKIQQNKNIYYAFNEKERSEIIATLNPNIKITIQRYKGLGEMDAQQLRETTMLPEKRKMLQVQIEDAYRADRIFETLMSENVEPRRDFISQNAKYVQNIDL